MKQQLGLNYSDTMPLSAIISNRLVDIQKTYGGMILLTSIQKKGKALKRTNTNQFFSDLQVHNLIHTYGLDKVLSVYNMIFTIDNSKKVG